MTWSGGRVSLLVLLLGIIAVRAQNADLPHTVENIFSQHCFKCHGAEKQKNGYRLDVKETAMRGGDSAEVAITPRDSKASALFTRITSTNDEVRMPPREALSSNEIANIKAWIDAGAEWPSTATVASATKHWAFQQITNVAPPKVRSSRVRNPIDAFIVARLEREHLKLSSEAERATLIRRLYLDLVGLLPPSERVRGFLKDRRADAYERLVDELLTSPHFGERWGRHWLDLARYADSAGYQVDTVRPGAYVYRDWVIQSFNRDQPFDEFTVEQLAGDLLPGATFEQKIATGFHRMTLSNLEDGVDKAEFECKAKVDRVATTGTAWLGLTVGCAECHTHKYDPITQREFYQLYAFFNQAAELNVRLTNATATPGNKRGKGLEALLLAQNTNATKTFVHLRGDFLRPGEEVQPAVLRALNTRYAPRNNGDRLDLAQWIVSPENPLTARVAVNRIWMHLFGRGIVATPEDFGKRGEAPSHPELLDWLANEFRSNGWSRKKLIRLIVTSATYRQSSAVTPEFLRRDPQNILLARQNRLRVEAEIVRDLFLDASGLLNRDIGGPSIYPAIPADVKAVGYGNGGKWIETEGAEKFRRGIYVSVRRTVPYPVAMTFDAANPNECTARREHSVTPLQSLALLNNPVFAECSEKFAELIATRNGSVPDKITWAFERCFARDPSRAERRRLTQLVLDVRQQSNDAQAWRAVAEVLLNMDEFLTRE